MPDTLTKLDFVGPTVDDDMRRLIRRYGVEAAQVALKSQSAGKPGRPHEKDWLLLADIIREDVRDWLAGGDPFQTRRSAAIARDFADEHPGQSRDSTISRIKLKLSRSRRYVTFCEAERLARTEYPYGQYLRALNALIDTGKSTRLWAEQNSCTLASIAEYTAKFGEPTPDMTIQQLEAEAAKPFTPTPAPENHNILQILTRSAAMKSGRQRIPVS